MLRRTDDRTMKLVLAAPDGWQERTPEFLESWADDATRRVRRLPEGTAPLLLVAELSASEPARVLPHPDGDAAAARLAGIDPQSWREEALRTRKRRELPDKLLAFFEELNRAECEGEVYRALASHALRIVGAYRAQVLLPDPANPARLRSAAGTTGTDPELCVARDPRLERPGLTCATEVHACGTGSPGGLAPLVSERTTCTATLAHVPVGDGGVLVLTERRDDRVFEAEDWDMLRALALQGEMTLKRVRLLEDVRSLALTDPLTGLANRRHMEVVLGCAWGAAQRGDPLAVIVVDLDGFKAVNDERGHLAGDALLQSVAAALRSEARGADTVVRYGGDEFLVILPGGGEDGARALLARVRERLAGRVEFSAGVAVHGPRHGSPDALIRDADRALYEGKRARGGVAR